MKLRTRIPSAIEPLESRIAPALLVAGANLLGGPGNPSTGETSAGDHSVTLVKVLAGQALVWFDHGHITSISFGPNTNLQVTGDFGDLVGNLTAEGRLSDSDNNPANGEDGSVLLPNNLLGLKTTPITTEKGTVGDIITGGSISGLSISGEISGVYAGDGVFRAESRLSIGGVVTSHVNGIDINPVESGVQSTFQFTQATSKFLPAASIANAKISQAAGLEMFAGSGNPAGVTFAKAGPAGGSISNIKIDSAFVPGVSPLSTPSYSIIAGDGADGKSGGAGGSVSHIQEKTSFGPVTIHAGSGGKGAGGSGGTGGSVSGLDLQSDSSRYSVRAGSGGDGAPAGNGGKLSNNNFVNRTPVSGIILSADFTGDGRDDILVVDAGTGQMVVSAATDTGFQQVVQHVTSASENVMLINSAGSNPVDAAAADVDGDGKLDIVVAYKNSSNIAVFYNMGGGVFWDPSLGATGDSSVATFPIGMSPAKIAVDGPNAQIIGIAENVNGQSDVRYAAVERGPSRGDLKLDVSDNANQFSQPVADLVYSHGAFLTGFNNGVISELDPAGLRSPKPFVVKRTNVSVSGGITDLEMDSTGNRLLALSAVSHTVSVFDTTNSTPTQIDSIALPVPGQPGVAHFVHDTNAATDDKIAVLSSLTVGSRLDLYAEPATLPSGVTSAFASVATFNSQLLLKNFVPSYLHPAVGDPAGDPVGYAALAGSLSQFTFTADLGSSAHYALPFASKRVDGHAGDGGTGLDIGKLTGRGGAGGDITGINVNANEIALTAGGGGHSASGPAGAGGSVINPASFITSGGASVVPTLLADVLLGVDAGDGGTPSLGGKTAAGGAGGSLSGLKITLDSGDITLTTGTGGAGRGGNGGAGGGLTGMQTVAHDGNLTLSTGDGGDALGATGNGGAGGSIAGFQHKLDLPPDIESKEKPYSVTISSGHGGTATGGQGGAGGTVAGVSLSLDGSNATYDDPSTNPPLVDAHVDNTVRVNVTTGAGGNGSAGGNGGALTGFTSNAVFDQVSRDGSIVINYFAMQLHTGSGGQGAKLNGGSGGSMLFVKPISGVTVTDPDALDANSDSFVAHAGSGGGGAVKGGVGGSVDGLVLQNAPFSENVSLRNTMLVSAVISAGDGGAGAASDGGAGGSVTHTVAGVEGGRLFVLAGNGGASGGGGKGGAGGSAASSTLGVVKTYSPLGLLVQGGDGGDGVTGGGAGGKLSALNVSTPESTHGISAILTAGKGGNVNAGGAVGGTGGDVVNLRQVKDLNSSINLIAAGAGGDNPLGAAGAGGSVAGIKTIGFIGRPSDGFARLGVFDQLQTGPGTFVEIPQGLYAGSGGAGASKGANGSITNVTARQIAAIAALNGNQTAFAAAKMVSSVKADLIGFDLDLSGTFDSTVVGGPSPTAAKPIDGFILASAIQKVSVLPAVSFIFTA